MLAWVTLLMFACSQNTPTTPSAVAPSTNSQAAATHWEMIGRVTPTVSQHPDAPPFEGGKELVARCHDRLPCAAERWRSENGEVMDILRLADKIHFPDGRKPWPARWMSINGSLRQCIGGPLSIPPTDDPQGIRTLETTADQGRWILHLSGENSCGLKGTMSLDTNKDKIDLSALTCEGKRWKEGGRECVRKKLAAIPK
ncbi:MAG: hypothetical protein CL930_10680 [Deltaproteobacteria bacterium]|nr:hypothetical protein [Deltaproteobacteria bacterium]